MAGKRIEIELSEEMAADLDRIVRELGFTTTADAATIGLSEWIRRRKSELDDRDPSSRYIVNEALDELINRKK
jgi:hypothetical protein